MRMFSLKIADFFIKISGSDRLAALPANYRPFEAELPEDAEVLLEMTVSDEDIDLTTLRLMGEFDDLGYRQEVYERQGGGYVFRISDTAGQCAATMESDSRFRYNRLFLPTSAETSAVFGFNNALMIAFAFSSAYHNTLMMHSSVIEKDGWGYMFLGKSGTGKSTHSSLWLRHVEGTELLNDDNPVLRINGGEAWVYGSPWSGKTPCYKQRRAKVGALVMLEQKPYNKITKENIVVALSSLMCSCSIMIWDKASYGEIMNTMSRVISLVGVHHLECLPDEAAACLSYQTIVKS